MRRYELSMSAETDVQWLRATMEHISRRFGIDVATVSDRIADSPPEAGVARTHPDRLRTKDSRTNSTSSGTKVKCSMGTVARVLKS